MEQFLPKSLVIMLILLFSMLGCSQQNREWEKERDEAFDLANNKGKVAESIELWENMLSKAEEEFGGNYNRVTEALWNLAIMYIRQRKYADAEPLYQRHLALDKKNLNENDPRIIITLCRLAGVYEVQNKHSKAASLYEEALKRSKRIGTYSWIINELGFMARGYENVGEDTVVKSLKQRIEHINALGR